MSLLTLIQKGGLDKVTTVTQATIATGTKKKSDTVANVATVTVTHRDNRNKIYGTVAMSEDAEMKIRTWLTSTGEDDLTVVADILEKCRSDKNALDYFLNRATECPASGF